VTSVQHDNVHRANALELYLERNSSMDRLFTLQSGLLGLNPSIQMSRLQLNIDLGCILFCQFCLQNTTVGSIVVKVILHSRPDEMNDLHQFI
jgi:hypothetical protein